MDVPQVNAGGEWTFASGDNYSICFLIVKNASLSITFPGSRNVTAGGMEISGKKPWGHIREKFRGGVALDK